MRLEDLRPGLFIQGLEPLEIVTIVAVVPIADGAIQIIYRMPNGTIKDRLLGRADEAAIAVATQGCPWTFDGDGEAFKQAVEAKRIDLAFLFDPMMAIHTSNVEPLPHQITAVYECMLPRQPLRFLLADDPGAGKTIMAGLYIREILMRADSRRILIVAPGSLVEQWRDEMFEKFGLEFHVFSKELEAATPSGNPFQDKDYLIVRLDQMARNESFQQKLCAETWDLVVFDEAHKLSAHFYGRDLKKTGRFLFAEKLSAHTRHLLLMTATPHNGKEEDFQLFLSLLDPDRFYGKFRDGVHQVSCSDLIRRMVKEKLVKFDGTPLFPERRAYTMNYKLSDLEAALYQSVTQYVKTEMGKADKLDGKHKGTVGFALTALQRRLASSPEAIFQSLKRRHERLEKRLQEEKAGGKLSLAETLITLPEDDDDLNAEEQENLEETLVDQATASQTMAELIAEIAILECLEQQARALVASGKDRKWDELSRILQNEPQIHDASGRMRKIIIFTEHRDTLNYLHAKIAGVLGNSNAIVVIHGSVSRDDRRKAQELFHVDPEIRVLIATDAAGEGINLQNANLMVNYDLPWNPNRLEQRFGRIHRIGQQEVCHLWHLVAKETREGDVYFRLLEKLRVVSEALQGQVFNVLGEVFENIHLKDMLIQAIRYGDQPEVRARLSQKIENALDHQHLMSLLQRDALAQETMTQDRLFAVREDMEKAEARRLQPYFIRSFFMQAFTLFGGSIYPRESGRFEITHVPAELRERSQHTIGPYHGYRVPVLKRYERVCFTKEAVRPLDRPGLALASMIHPGHPLMLALTHAILDRYANLLRQGATLVDPTDQGEQPSLLVLLTHEIKAGNGQVISKRLQFIRILPDGKTMFAGWAPHLDLEPLSSSERAFLLPKLNIDSLTAGFEQRALAFAATNLVPEHYQEIADSRIAHIDKVLAAVHERLTQEIEHWSNRFIQLSDEKAAGKDVHLNLENIRRTIGDLEARLESRKKELQAMRHVVSAMPVVLSNALIIPIGLLQKLRGTPATPGSWFSHTPATRSRIEQIAIDTVRNAEQARGCRVVDVSDQKCGWDLTSYPPAVGNQLPKTRHIEVKGRAKGAATITMTRNEIFTSWNQGDSYILAIVLVDEDDSIVGPYYIHHPFQEEPGLGISSINYDLKALLEKSRKEH